LVEAINPSLQWPIWWLADLEGDWSTTYAPSPFYITENGATRVPILIDLQRDSLILAMMGSSWRLFLHIIRVSFWSREAAKS
jgi:hypothetical protein